MTTEDKKISEQGQYQTIESYPKYTRVGEVLIGTVKCVYCERVVTLDGHKLSAHIDQLPERTCEGSGRYYWHLYGVRLRDEQ